VISVALAIIVAVALVFVTFMDASDHPSSAVRLFTEKTPLIPAIQPQMKAKSGIFHLFLFWDR